MDRGILLAADRNQEWLLPWWWNHYIRHNSHPVAIVDLGMTPQARSWCDQRMLSLSFPPLKLPLFTKETIPLKRRNQWERLFGAYIWGIRPIWFQKPFILQLTPFDTTLWLDLDCMVRVSLETVFQVLQFGVQVALAREADSIQIRDGKEKLRIEGEISYNTGVIGYQKDGEFLPLAIERILEAQEQFVSDQNVISRVLFEHKIPCFELSRLYNWSLCTGINEEAIIHHYCSAFWKMAILKSIKPNLGEHPVLPPPFDPDMY